MIGKPGSGKGSFVKFLTLMMGASKVFETAEPSIYVWGHFNPLMATCYLVNLNELSKKEFNGCENRFKSLQTDPSMTIHGKNVNPFKTVSYHKWLITTNNDYCADASKGQRRNTVIRGSDEKCGDKAYFTDLNRAMSDRNVIKTCFEYYRNLDISDFLSIFQAHARDRAPKGSPNLVPDPRRELARVGSPSSTLTTRKPSSCPAPMLWCRFAIGVPR